MSRIAELLILCLTAGAGPIELSKESDGVVYSAHRSFRIPLDLSEKERQRIAAVRLYTSKDGGKNWSKETDSAPDATVLSYKADSDAVYWFSIALVDAEGKQTPEKIEEVDPGLKVVVDTNRPTLVLKPIRNKSGRRGLRWEHTDDHLDPASMRLAYQEAGNEEWRPFAIAAEDKSVVWFPVGASPTKIQGMVRDKAGNFTAMEVTLDGDRFSKRVVPAFAIPDDGAGPMTAADPSSPPPPKPVAKIPTAIPRSMINDPEVTQTVHTRPAIEHTANSSPASLEPKETKGTFTKSRKVSINYELEQSGAGSRVELWSTRDRGENWRLLVVDEDGKSPVAAELDQDGEWGLLVVVNSAGGSAAGAPKAGAQPDLYVNLDTERPMVELASPELQRDVLAVRWLASDKHLTASPVEIHTSAQPSGPWKRVAQKLGSQGEFLWNFAKDGVSGRTYLKVTAKDQAGNIGAAETPREVVLTAAPSVAPRAKVVGIAPTPEDDSDAH